MLDTELKIEHNTLELVTSLQAWGPIELPLRKYYTAEQQNCSKE